MRKTQIVFPKQYTCSKPVSFVPIHLCFDCFSRLVLLHHRSSVPTVSGSFNSPLDLSQVTETLYLRIIPLITAIRMLNNVWMILSNSTLMHSIVAHFHILWFCTYFISYIEPRWLSGAGVSILAVDQTADLTLGSTLAEKGRRKSLPTLHVSVDSSNYPACQPNPAALLLMQYVEA